MFARMFCSVNETSGTVAPRTAVARETRGIMYWPAIVRGNNVSCKLRRIAAIVRLEWTKGENGVRGRASYTRKFFHLGSSANGIIEQSARFLSLTVYRGEGRPECDERHFREGLAGGLTADRAKRPMVRPRGTPKEA